MDNITSTELQTFIQEEYQRFIYLWLLVSSIALLFYSTMLSFDNEIKYVWKQKFTIPRLLYCLARYPILLSQTMLLSLQLLPATAPESTCNVLLRVMETLLIPTFVGVQGLISLRAYSLYRGNWILALGLGILLIVGLGCVVASLIFVPGCTKVETKNAEINAVIQGITVVLTDTVVFIATVHKLWGTWRLQRQIGFEIAGGGNFTELLLVQGVLQYGFVFFVTVTNTAATLFTASAFSHLFDLFQNTLSIILICDFSLDLWARNPQMMTSQHDIAALSSIEFPARGVRNFLCQVHDTLASELGEPSQHNDLNGSRRRDGEDAEDTELETGNSNGQREGLGQCPCEHV